MAERKRNIFKICQKGGENKIEEKIQREKKFIEETIKILQKKLKKKKLTKDEIVAISKYTYDVYSGIENILKITLKHKGIELPDTITWHRDLLEVSCSSRIISNKLLESMQELLGFRHFVAHGYSVILHKERVIEICRKTITTWQNFKKEVKI